jgi:hypothetical protein
MTIRPWVWALLAPSGLLAQPATTSIAGIWQAEGYGTIWELAADTLQSWEVTTTTCVRAGRYARSPAPPPGASVAFLDGVVTAWIIRPGATSRRFVAHSPGTASDVVFHQLPAIPSVCTPPTPDTREGNFAVFERTMAEQYAFFSLRGLDWSSTVTRAREKLGQVRDSRGFYDILEQMVAPLEDRHTDVTATDLNVRVRHYRRSGGALDPAMFERVRANPPRRYLVGPLETWCQDWLQYGELQGSIGYLRILREYSYTPSGRFEDDSLALTQALDSIMPRVARLRGLVVDIRMNGGGFDAISLLIASRFTGAHYLGFSKQTRSDPLRPDRFTPLQAVHVRAASGARYTGPVVLLTGPYTLSAGEVLTLALLGRQPRITRIGEATQGIFADELLRQLPNGWRFQLSTERYLTPAGENFEGRGIAPDRPVPVFPLSDLETGRDGALEAALEVFR